MGMYGWLDYSGDNEPQDEGTGGSGNQSGGPKPSEQITGCLGCLIGLAVTGLIIWYFVR